MNNMRKFTKMDIKRLLSDLLLYSGNIDRISDLHGPHEHNGGSYSGVIHTYMDSFNFTTQPFFCDEESWAIQLAQPVMSLLRGHRMLMTLIFPKIHKSPELMRRYKLANRVYHAYNGHSGMCEDHRLKKLEEELGFSGLPTYTAVLNAIISGYRSYERPQ